MTSLQCAATLLVVPAALLDVDLLGLSARRVAWVWTDRAGTGPAERAATGLGVGVTVREDVAGREALHEIADRHPGETVLVVSTGVTEAIEVLADADGWVVTRWGPAEAGPSE